MKEFFTFVAVVPSLTLVFKCIKFFLLMLGTSFVTFMYIFCIISPFFFPSSKVLGLQVSPSNLNFVFFLFLLWILFQCLNFFFIMSRLKADKYWTMRQYKDCVTKRTELFYRWVIAEDFLVRKLFYILSITICIFL